MSPLETGRGSQTAAKPERRQPGTDSDGTLAHLRGSAGRGRSGWIRVGNILGVPLRPSKRVQRLGQVLFAHLGAGVGRQVQPAVVHPDHHRRPTGVFRQAGVDAETALDQGVVDPAYRSRRNEGDRGRNGAEVLGDAEPGQTVPAVDAVAADEEPSRGAAGDHDGHPGPHCGGRYRRVADPHPRDVGDAVAGAGRRCADGQPEIAQSHFRRPCSRMTAASRSSGRAWIVLPSRPSVVVAAVSEL